MQTKQNLRHLPDWLAFIIIIIYLLHAIYLMDLGYSAVLNRNTSPKSVQCSKSWSGLSANPEIMGSSFLHK